jgi:hypothetical protein
MSMCKEEELYVRRSATLKALQRSTYGSEDHLDFTWRYHATRTLCAQDDMI